MLKDVVNNFKNWLCNGKFPSPMLSLEEMALLNLDCYVEGETTCLVDSIETNGNSKLLLVDDEPAMGYIYKNAFNRIQQFTSFNVYHDFDIKLAFGKVAPLIAFNTISKCKDIEYAILDLTLGYSFKVNTEMTKDPKLLNRIIILDGVDLAILLNKLNPNVKLLFLTSHSNDFSISIIKPYEEKFYHHFNDHIVNYYMSKSEVKREERLFKFLYNRDYEESIRR